MSGVPIPLTGIGRPSNQVAPARRCQGQSRIGGGRTSPCGQYALWVLPEEPWCAHHLPPHLIALVNERRSLWNELAAEVWAHVLAERPIAAGPDSPS